MLFNLDHPNELVVVTEVNEDGGDDDEDLIENEADSDADELQQRFNKMTFVVASKKLEQLPHWIKVTDVFMTDSDAVFLKSAGVTGFDDPRYEKYSSRLARLRGIRKYMYRMDVLERTLSYDEVTEIFVRVNSLGTKLRGSDLALAQITAKWRGSLKTFESFQGKCAEDGFDLDLGIHLKNLIAFATGQSRFLTVGNLQEDQLRSSWKESCKGMEFALNFLKANVGIDSPALLSSPFILVTIGYYGHKRNYKLSADDAKSLKFWVLSANAKGRYSRGSTETFLDQDLTTIKQEGNASELIERLRLQIGRLDISPEELDGRTQRSALFKTMFLAFRESGAKDWRDQLTIALDHSGSQHRLQFHHIFPKALLKKNGIDREADDIANLAFISSKENKTISDKAPSIYLPQRVLEIGQEQLEAQCIPMKKELLLLENYGDFLKVRRRLIAKRLNEFLGLS